MTLLCLFVAGTLLAVLTKSQTKIFWYLAPATPFLALAVGLGLSDGLAWLRQRERAHRAFVQPRLAYLAVAAIFATANLGAIYYYQFGVEKKLSSSYMGGRYGPFLEEIRDSNLTRNLVLLDEGSSEAMIDNQSGDFDHYSPEADFYAKLEDAQECACGLLCRGVTCPQGPGLPRAIRVPIGGSLPTTKWLSHCNPALGAHSSRPGGPLRIRCLSSFLHAAPPLDDAEGPIVKLIVPV